MIVKFKKLHPDAVMPIVTPGNAGADLTAIDMVYTNKYLEYDTGIAVEIPEGFVGLVFPRSSISSNTGLTLANSVGVIDSSYRGPIKLRFRYNNSVDTYGHGDKIGQLVIMPYPTIEYIESDELSETERGESGFGSTGK